MWSGSISKLLGAAWGGFAVVTSMVHLVHDFQFVIVGHGQAGATAVVGERADL